MSFDSTGRLLVRFAGVGAIYDGPCPHVRYMGTSQKLERKKKELKKLQVQMRTKCNIMDAGSRRDHYDIGGVRGKSANERRQEQINSLHPRINVGEFYVDQNAYYLAVLPRDDKGPYVPQLFSAKEMAMGAPNGYYTYIYFNTLVYGPQMLFAFIESSVEIGCKHADLLRIALSRFASISAFVYAGEAWKKDKDTLEFNFYSGTYMLDVRPDSLAVTKLISAITPGLRVQFRDYAFPLQDQHPIDALAYFRKLDRHYHVVVFQNKRDAETYKKLKSFEKYPKLRMIYSNLQMPTPFADSYVKFERKVHGRPVWRRITHAIQENCTIMLVPNMRSLRL